MKIYLIAILAAASVCANAQTPVFGSIYMALGANQFQNYMQLKGAISEAGYPEEIALGKLSFSGAVVEGNKVTYKHSLVKESDLREICSLNTTFTVDTEYHAVYNVRAAYSCDKDKD